jgi:hypothetical protein
VSAGEEGKLARLNIVPVDATRQPRQAIAGIEDEHDNEDEHDCRERVITRLSPGSGPYPRPDTCSWSVLPDPSDRGRAAGLC